MEQEQARALAGGERPAIHRDAVLVPDVQRGAGQHFAIDRDPALFDPQLGVAARAQADARHHLGDALALMRLFRLKNFSLGFFAGRLAAGLRAGPGFLGLSFSMTV